MSRAIVNRLQLRDGNASRVASYFRMRESVLDLTWCAIDGEGSDGPSVAVFDAKTGSQAGTPTSGLLLIRNLDLAVPRPDVPIFLLSGSKGANPGVFELSGECRIHGDRKAPLVKVTDKGSWKGTVHTHSEIGGAGVTIDDPGKSVKAIGD